MAAEAEAAWETRAKVCIELWQLKQKQLGRLKLRCIYRAMAVEAETAREARAQVCIELWQLKQKQLGRLEVWYI